MSFEVVTYNKAILVIFIIFICQANIKLLAKVIRTPLFYQSVKLMTILSLVIGDLILVFFPLGVRLVLLFRYEIYSSSQFIPPCSLNIATSAYSDYLLHFVYSFGLIVLGVEILFRKQFVNCLNKTGNALIASSFPWFLGLVVVLPQCFTNVDYDQCEDKRDFKSLIAVSVLSPVLFALLMSIIFNSIKLPNSRQVQVVRRNHQTDHFHPDVDRNYYNLQVVTDSNIERSSIPLISSQASDNSSLVTLNYSRDSTSQHCIRQSNSNQARSVQQQEVIQVEIEDLRDSCERRKELKVLALISIVFVIMIVPLYAFFLLARMDGSIDEIDANVIGPILLGWLVLARSFVTPSIIAYFF